ncbi:uncharacterized protein LOC123261368 [Cotesia glomerata]|uniref:uncharacterized protein LOC123261368 n=1 Tax=Cotesia glomerata TaxID=32391 RepID=UPI001D02C091|nr:uncharacterized protein LOC123261368 [Cotesia glomerata]
MKKDVPDEQVCTTVNKINKTRSGDLLITISRKSEDKGQGLQQTIANILKEEAEVICKGPQENIEIRDLDDTTTKEDIQVALHTVTKELCEIPPETIKIRKAYSGTQTAVVTLPTAAAQKILEGSAASINDIRFYSCYAPSSLSIAEFTDFLDRLTEDAKQYHPVAIAGDFNAWAVDWGSKQTNARGKALREEMASLDVVLLNIGKTPTYTKGKASSIIDLTFVSSSLLKGNYSWEVLNTYTASDHNAILWEILAGWNP